MNKCVGNFFNNLCLICNIVSNNQITRPCWEPSFDEEIDSFELLALLLLHLRSLLLLVAHQQPVLLVPLQFGHVGHVLFHSNADGLVPPLQGLLHLHCHFHVIILQQDCLCLVLLLFKHGQFGLHHLRFVAVFPCLLLEPFGSFVHFLDVPQLGYIPNSRLASFRNN